MLSNLFNRLIGVSVFLLFEVLVFGQGRQDANLVPFKKGSVEDSLRVAAYRVKLLLGAQKEFEKTYLRKQLALMPVSPELSAIFPNGTTFLESQQYAALLEKYPAMAKAYGQFDRHLNHALDSINRTKRIENADVERIIRQSPQVQTGVVEIYLRTDYAIVLVPARFFTTIDKGNPTKNKVIDTLQEKMEQALLGKPHDLDGYINSINYVPFDLKKMKMPVLVDALVRQNLRLWQEIIDVPAYKNSIRGVRINDVEIYNRGKLWLDTKIDTKTIYLSPYLLRAVFNISFYQDTIIRRAVALENDDDDIIVYFRGKSGASVRPIDSAYFENFVKRFSANLFFVLGHELAHIYLDGKADIGPNRETACDTYAAYFYLKHFGVLEMGVFQTMLISAIKSGELEFWGTGINEKALQRRYDNLLALSKARNANSGLIQITIP